MAKAKSSASSATRRKHAAQAAKKAGDEPSTTPQQPPQRGQKKAKVSRFEPKVKSYTPPPPPPKGEPDPINLYLQGGAAIDPELLVILRLLGKRDEASLARGVEGLDAWAKSLENVTEEDDAEGQVEQLERCMDVWAHHLPRLILHPSRRLRLLSLTLHSQLTMPSSAYSLTSTRAALLKPLWSESTSYIGSWASSSFDGDRACRALGAKSWDASDLTWEDDGVWDFALSLVLQPPVTRSGDEVDDPSLLQAQGLLAVAHIVSTGKLEVPWEPLAQEGIWDLLTHDSPAALRRAAYELLGVLSEKQGKWDEDQVRLVGERVLHFVWGQSEGWAGVIGFLRKYPEAWTITDSPSSEESTSAFLPSTNLSHLLQHLRTSCSTTPSLYPTVLLLLSTLPSSILPPTLPALESLFEAFFTPVPSPEWASAALECLMYEGAKLQDTVEMKELLGHWIGELFKYAVKGRAGRKLPLELEKALGRLITRDLDLFNAPWASICSTALLQGNLTPALAQVLNACATSDNSELAKQGKQLSIDCALLALEREELGFLDSVRKSVETDERVSEALLELSLTRLPLLLRAATTQPESLAFLTSQLSSSHLPASTKSLIWESLFQPSPIDALTLSSLLAEIKSGRIDGAGLNEAGLDALVHEMSDRVLDGLGGEGEEEVIIALVTSPTPFISTETASKLLGKTGALLASRTESAIRGSEEVTPDSAAAIRILTPSMGSLDDAAFVALFKADVLLGYSEAKGLWESKAGDLADPILKMLSKLLLDEQTSLSPIEIVTAAATLLSATSASTLTLPDLLPESPVFASLGAACSSEPPASLSIFQPLISQSSSSDLAPLTCIAFPRVMLALLDIAARDTRWARSSLWTLPHLLRFIDVAHDELAMPRGIFPFEAVDEETVTAAEGLASYILSSAGNSLQDGWHASAVTFLRAKEAGVTNDGLISVLDSLARLGRGEKEVYARRAFSSVLAATLKYTDGSVQDAERWLAWGQSLPEGSQLTCAIVLAVKNVLFESPRFERYQNELAATLAGVPPSAASSRGLGLLRVLLASAPPLDAPIIFLPQQRTMFLVQRIQAWIGSDDDLVEEIHSAIAELFLHLAPIVQDLSGSHWDLVFDIIESNLETASWDEDVSLPPMYHSCRLLAMLKDLASSNRDLQSIVKARIEKPLELVRDLFVSRPVTGKRHQPRSAVLEVMASLIRDLPPKLLSMGASFDQLLHLLEDPSLSVQQSAYELLSRIATKYVSDLVVELELDGDSGESVIELPSALVSLISSKLALETVASPELYPNASTFLLAWLLVFQFFDAASPRIKASYVDQLRNLDTVATVYIPSLFGLLHLSDRTRAFDVTPWAVDDFELELVDEISSVTLPVFATFVYFRSLQAIPSLIRSWWEACRNRQLSMAVSSFTSKHFSPVLIARELAHLRDPNDPAGKALRDNDDFTVKVAAGANEVKAVFVVDEQSMEIGIRLPSEFPLQGVEVKDVRKVGVTDAQWRAWMLAVQQVVTTQNGLIADALGLFKRNVTLHFEGVEACAICYSVISVVDRSLPTKACRTCNNRFHAGCLFKWFSTSHGSSCPLCRSLF